MGGEKVGVWVRLSEIKFVRKQQNSRKMVYLCGSETEKPRKYATCVNNNTGL